MGNASRVHTVIDTDNVATQITTVPIQIKQFTSLEVKEPETLARQLNQTIGALTAATAASRSHPRNQSIVFEGKSFNAAEEKTVTHGLGHAVRWAVVRWHNSATGEQLYEVSQTDQALTLHSVTAGTADIEVW